MISEAAIWHELECGSYEADVECWQALAGEYTGPVLDVGSGNGRVALMLAGLGHNVTALDIDQTLLTALTARADGLTIDTFCADARSFQTGRHFSLIIVPMLTVQLFGGTEGRSEFFAAAAAQLSPGGCLALAIADLLDDEEGAAGGESPEADSCMIGSVGYSTRAIALRQRDGQIGIERRREITAPSGSVTVQAATDWIDILSPEQLESEAAAAGFTVAPRRQIPATAEYIGSAVICLNA
jgi:SAM-dependent methyltransferase